MDCHGANNNRSLVLQKSLLQNLHFCKPSRLLRTIWIISVDKSSYLRFCFHFIFLKYANTSEKYPVQVHKTTNKTPLETKQWLVQITSSGATMKYRQLFSNWVWIQIMGLFHWPELSCLIYGIIKLSPQKAKNTRKKFYFCRYSYWHLSAFPRKTSGSATVGDFRYSWPQRTCKGMV